MLQRKQNEKEFHNYKTEAKSGVETTNKHLDFRERFYHATWRSQIFLHQWILGRCQGKIVLDYGCGSGVITYFIAEKGANLAVGIDISDMSIKAGIKRYNKEGVSSRMRFALMDAERLGFTDSSFDIINCHSILHHLDLQRAYSELARVIKPNGEIICNEPLAHNPIIQCYRRMTPKLRTRWEIEHMLDRRSVALANEYFGNVQTRFFGLATLVAAPLYGLPGFNFMLKLMEFIDSLLLRLPGLKWQAWQIIIVLSQPRTRPSGRI